MNIFVHRDGQQLGPFSSEDVRARLAAGQFSPADLAWHDGQPSWISLSELLSQQAFLRNAPTTSGLAIASLVLGIASLFTCLFAGLPAIICGHMARAEVRKSFGRVGGDGMAVAGLVLGYMNVILVAAFIALGVLGIATGMAIPMISKASQSGAASVSSVHVRQILLACNRYASDNGGRFPDTLEQLSPDYVADRSVLTCPLLHEPGAVGYLYFGGKLSDPPEKVLVASKAKLSDGRRVVGHVDGSVQLERYEPTF